jgi:hypothetical protein
MPPDGRNSRRQPQLPKKVGSSQCLYGRCLRADGPSVGYNWILVQPITPPPRSKGQLQLATFPKTEMYSMPISASTRSDTAFCGLQWTSDVMLGGSCDARGNPQLQLWEETAETMLPATAAHRRSELLNNRQYAFCSLGVALAAATILRLWLARSATRVTIAQSGRFPR